MPTESIKKYINSLPLRQTANDLKSGKLPLLDFIETLCNRIEEFEPYVLSLLPETNRRDRLMTEAKRLLEKFPDPTNRPPLFGIAVGVKDLFNVDGFETRAGSRLPSSLFKGKESFVVTQLKENGALILGKTVSTEFAYFEPGPTRNPHNIVHTPGGSSSGSAAAVACGITPLALGTQTIGSVSRPASFCGIYGFKPTLGRLPTDGVVPFSPTADHVGFFSQDIEGIEFICSIILPGWKSENIKSIEKPTIGIANGSYLNQADDEMLEWFHMKIEILKEKNLKVVELDLFGDISEINKLHRSIISFDFAHVHENWFKDFESQYSIHSKNLIIEGREVSQQQFVSALKAREVLLGKIERVQKENRIDIWLSPSALGAAPDGLTSTGSPLMNLPWTFLGVPTLSIPSGFNSQGLPLGLQVAGAFGKDEEMINCCKLLNGILF